MRKYYRLNIALQTELIMHMGEKLIKAIALISGQRFKNILDANRANFVVLVDIRYLDKQ